MSNREPAPALSSPSLTEIEVAAVVAVQDWLTEAELVLDQQFGTGYAGKHPAVVTGFLLSCSVFYHAERMTDVGAALASAASVIAEME